MGRTSAAPALAMRVLMHTSSSARSCASASTASRTRATVDAGCDAIARANSTMRPVAWPGGGGGGGPAPARMCVTTAVCHATPVSARRTHERFTAVGRDASSSRFASSSTRMSPALSCRGSCHVTGAAAAMSPARGPDRAQRTHESQSAAAASNAARAMPYAPAAPIAGAPRTCMHRILSTCQSNTTQDSCRVARAG